MILASSRTAIFSLVAAAGALHAADPLLPDTAPAPVRPGMHLLWSDEFDREGPADPAVWSHENGFVRNQELQWYQPANAACKGGVLRIEGRKERVPNPKYVAGSTDWKTSRQYAEYTSSSITSSGRKTWQFGHIAVRARLDAQAGSWPAIWTLGSRGEWPSNGEVDLMEFYQVGGVPTILANLAWGTATRWQAKWNSKTRAYSTFTAKDPDWARKFHLWTMDWTRDSIVLRLDGAVMNAASLAGTKNADGTNPFQDRSQYILLNLAMGGNGGDPSRARFPMLYEVDYVRVYQNGPVGTSARDESSDWSIRPRAGTPGLFVATRSGSEVPAHLEVFDPGGRQVASLEFATESVHLDFRAKARGVYLVRLHEGGTVRSTTVVR